MSDAPVAYRYRYPGPYGGWRFSNGEEINGSRPIESEPVYSAEALAAQSAQLARMAQALRPFAAMGVNEPMDGQRRPVGEVICRDGIRRSITEDHFRAAARAISEMEG